VRLRCLRAASHCSQPRSPLPQKLTSPTAASARANPDRFGHGSGGVATTPEVQNEVIDPDRLVLLHIVSDLLGMPLQREAIRAGGLLEPDYCAQADFHGVLWPTGLAREIAQASDHRL
jgi:hypothetical protein